MSKKGGHHGGSWKVAYADFVTAMMALFLCLWLTSQDQKIKDSVERAFRNPFSSVTKESSGIIASKDTTDGSHAASQGQFQSANAAELEVMKHISEDLAKILQQQDEELNSIKIDVTADGVHINVFDRALKPIFEADTDVFTPYGTWVFSTLAWEIARFNTFRIELEGHTEANAQKSPETHSQWELSTERANAARRKLVQSGVASSQICKVSGFADTAPMADLPRESEANRRVTVMLKLKESMQSVATAAPAPAPNDTRPN